MVHKLAMVAAIVVLLLSRLFQGSLSECAENPEAIKAAVSKLEGLPLAFGPWQGETLPALDPATITEARVAGYVWRRYRNSLTGEFVSVLLVCGPPEPIALHSPDVCYRGAGYLMVGLPETRTVYPTGLSQRAMFWTARFRKANAVAPEQLRLYWAWQAQDKWEAPESPLRAFASFPALYKVYVISDTTHMDGEAPPDKDPCEEFLDSFLPEFQKAVGSQP